MRKIEIVNKCDGLCENAVRITINDEEFSKNDEFLWISRIYGEASEKCRVAPERH